MPDKNQYDELRRGQSFAGFAQAITPKQQYSWDPNAAHTNAQVEARIWEQTADNPVTRSKAYAELDKEYSTPGSKYFDRYRQATSEWARSLADYGFDVSGGINDDFFSANNGYMTAGLDGLLSDKSGKPASPGKGATDDQLRAYALYQAQMDWETTKAAKAEMDDLSRNVAYWAGKGLTDAEIRDKVGADFSKRYKTLQSIQDSRGTGTYVPLTEAVDYNDDTITGMIWAARNGDDSGDWNRAAVHHYLGNGRMEPVNRYKLAQRTPGNVAYHPYIGGSNMDEARMLFGVDKFDMDWLEKNREAALNDPTLAGAYVDVYNAEERTINAENELAELKQWVNGLGPTKIPEGMSVMEMAEQMVADYFSYGDTSTLDKMDSGRATGKPVNLTRSVDYRREDIVARVARQIQGYEEPKKSNPVADFFDWLGSLFSGGEKPAETTAAPTVTRATSEPAATKTPAPTATPNRTATQAPTATPAATATPAPTAATSPATVPVSTAAQAPAAAPTNETRGDYNSSVGGRPALSVHEPEGSKKADSYNAMQGETEKPSMAFEEPTAASTEEPVAIEEPAAQREPEKDTRPAVMRTQEEALAAVAAKVTGEPDEEPTAEPETSGQPADTRPAMMRTQEEALAAAMAKYDTEEMSFDEEYSAVLAARSGRADPTTSEKAYAIYGQMMKDMPELFDILPGDALDSSNGKMIAVNNVRAVWGSDVADAIVAAQSSAANEADAAKLYTMLHSYYKAAEAEGYPLYDYIEDTDGVLESIQDFTEGIREREDEIAAYNAAVAEQNKEDALASARDLLRQISSGDLSGITDAQKQLLASVTDVTDADLKNCFTSGAAADALYSEIGMARSAYWESDEGYNASVYLFDWAQDACEQAVARDYKLAQACGMTLDEMYEAHPEMRPNAETLWQQGVQAYQDSWDAANLTEDERSGLGILGVAYNGAMIGWNDLLTGNISGITALAAQEDSTILNQNAFTYQQKYGPEAAFWYRQDVLTAISNMADDERKATYLNMLNEADLNGTNVFRIPIQFSLEDLQNAHDSIAQNTAGRWEFVRENGTDAEIQWVGYAASAVTSGLQFIEQAALTGITGSAGVASAITFAPSSFGQGYEFGRANGLSVDQSKLLGAVLAIVEVGTEADAVEGVYMKAAQMAKDELSSMAMSIAEKDGLRGIAKLLNAAKAYGIEYAGNVQYEFVQEMLQDITSSAVKSVAVGSTEPLRDTLTIDNAIDTLFTTALSSGLMTAEANIAQSIAGKLGSWGVGEATDEAQVPTVEELEQMVAEDAAPVEQPAAPDNKLPDTASELMAAGQEATRPAAPDIQEQVEAAAAEQKAANEAKAAEAKDAAESVGRQAPDNIKPDNAAKVEAQAQQSEQPAAEKAKQTEEQKQIGAEMSEKRAAPATDFANKYIKQAVAFGKRLQVTNLMTDEKAPTLIRALGGLLDNAAKQMASKTADDANTGYYPRMAERFIEALDAYKANPNQINKAKALELKNNLIKAFKGYLARAQKSVKSSEEKQAEQAKADAQAAVKQSLTNQVQAIFSSPEAVERLKQTQVDKRLAMQEVAGAVDNAKEVAAAKKAYDTARDKADEAEEAYEEAKKKVDNLSRSTKRAADAYKADAANPVLKEKFDKQSKALEAAKAKRKAALNKRNAAQASVEQLKADYDQARKDARETLRGQIQDQVGAEFAQIIDELNNPKKAEQQEQTAATEEQEKTEQAGQAEQAAAEKVKQEEAAKPAASEKKAKDFVDMFFSEEDEETKAELRERYMQREDTGAKVSRKGVDFVSAVSRKFGVKIGFTDSHGLFKGVRMQDGSIVLDRNATIGDALKTVLTHELVHNAEGTKTYNALKKAVVQMVYGGDAEAFAKAVDAETKNYQGQLGKDFTDGEQEVIAEGVARLLGESGFADRLAAEQPSLAQRVLDSVRDFLRRVGAVKSNELDQLRDLEKNLEKALREGPAEGDTKYSLLSDVDNNSQELFFRKINEINAAKQRGLDIGTKTKDGKEYMVEANQYMLYTDGNVEYPYISNVYKVNSNDGTVIARAMRIIRGGEERGRRLHETLEAARLLLGKGVLTGKYMGQYTRDAWKNSGRNGKYSGKSSRKGKNRYSLGELHSGQKERQYSNVTGQNAEINPDYVKENLLSIPENRYYTQDSNEAQQLRAVDRISQGGADASFERLMNLDNMTADDVAEAQVLQAIYFSEQYSNPERALALSSHYAQLGTTQAQGLQARAAIKKMTPTGMQSWLASHYSDALQQAMNDHPRDVDAANAEAERIAGEIGDLDATNAVDALNDEDTFFAPTTTNNRWNTPMNDRQMDLIHQLHLDRTARPGTFYNKATTDQRMLESIIMTADPLAPAGDGMNLVQRLELMRNGMPVLLPSDVAYITDNMREYVNGGADAQMSRGSQLALARAYEAAANITPATMRERIRTWRYTSMLLSVPSSLRNVMGNGLQNAVNAFAHDIVATNIDRAVASRTGVRTVENISAEECARGWEAFTEETRNTFLDHFVDRAITRPEGVHYSPTNRGRVFQSNVPEAMRTMENYLMSFGDRNFWAMAYANSMSEQRRLAELNGTEFDPVAADERARADADYSIFNEDNHVRDAISRFKREAGLAGDFVDLIVPFTGVPSNITRRMIEYSPFGLATTMIRHAARNMRHEQFDQADFVNGMARGLTGTGMYLAGMALYAIGAVKLGTGSEDDRKKAGVESALGMQYSPYISLFGTNISLSALAPAVSPIIMGAAAMDAVKDDDGFAQALWNASKVSMDQIFDASYLSGLKDLFDGDGDSIAENGLLALGNSAVSQMIPAPISQLATALDPYVRDTKDKNAIMKIVKTNLLAKIPGLRQMLPEKVDVAGRNVMNSKFGIASFVNPFNTTVADDDPVLTDMLRLAEETGETGFLPGDVTYFTLNKKRYTFTREEHTEFMKYYGQKWHEIAERSGYQGMSDERKADMYKQLTDAALKDAKAWWARTHK